MAEGKESGKQFRRWSTSASEIFNSHTHNRKLQSRCWLRSGREEISISANQRLEVSSPYSHGYERLVPWALDSGWVAIRVCEYTRKESRWVGHLQLGRRSRMGRWWTRVCWVWSGSSVGGFVDLPLATCVSLKYGGMIAALSCVLIKAANYLSRMWLRLARNQSYVIFAFDKLPGGHARLDYVIRHMRLPITRISFDFGTE